MPAAKVQGLARLAKWGDLAWFYFAWIDSLARKRGAAARLSRGELTVASGRFGKNLAIAGPVLSPACDGEKGGGS
jgi:hypothetical protein